MQINRIAEVKKLKLSIEGLKIDLDAKRVTLGKGSTGFNGLVSRMINSVMDMVRGKEEDVSLSNPEEVPCVGDIESCEEHRKNLKDMNNLKVDIRDIENEIKSKESKIDELNNSISQYLPGEQAAYHALQDTCLEYLDGPYVSNYKYPDQFYRYTYKYCWFKNIDQNNLLLGSFDKSSWIIKDGRMKFENGAKCHNGPIRHVIVQLVCSPVEEIISIAEPNMCEYFLKIGTASFCEILPGDRHENVDDEL